MLAYYESVKKSETEEKADGKAADDKADDDKATKTADDDKAHLVMPPNWLVFVMFGSPAGDRIDPAFINPEEFKNKQV